LPRTGASKPIAEYVIGIRGLRVVELIAELPLTSVTLSEDIATSERFAVKSLLGLTAGSPESALSQETFIRKVESLAGLIHPCVIKLKGYSLPTRSQWAMVVLESCSTGPLESAITNRPQWWNATRKAISIAGIVAGTMAIHSGSIIHQDLKPSNVLFDERFRVRLCDFGVTRSSEGGVILTQGVGTPFYMAPELFNEGDCSNRVDVSAFGILLYDILTGEWAWPRTLTPAQLTRRVNLVGERPPIGAIAAPFRAALVAKCWAQNPQDRPSFIEIFGELVQNKFQILPDVHPAEVSRYLKWIADN
jgi:serine/threonine protein kinase